MTAAHHAPLPLMPPGPPSPSAGRPFVLLDRDGTLIVDKNYLSDPAGVELFPGVGRALRLLREQGFGLIVVTNQSGIGRGYYSEADMRRVNERMTDLLAAEGARLDAIYHCPHAPEEPCDCRKPLPGMALRAAADFGFDPAASFVIGDKCADVELAQAMDGTGILVRTGNGATEEKRLVRPAGYVADTLEDATDWIMNECLRRRRGLCEPGEGGE